MILLYSNSLDLYLIKYNRNLNDEEAVMNEESVEEPMVIRFKRQKAVAEEDEVVTSSCSLKISLRTSKQKEEERKLDCEDESQSKRRSSGGDPLSQQRSRQVESSDADEVVEPTVSIRGKRGRPSNASEENTNYFEVTREKPRRGRPRVGDDSDSRVSIHSPLKGKWTNRNSVAQQVEIVEERNIRGADMRRSSRQQDESHNGGLVTRTGRKIHSRIQEEEKGKSPSSRRSSRERRVSYADSESDEEDSESAAGEASSEELARVSTRGQSRGKTGSLPSRFNSDSAEKLSRVIGKGRRTSKKPRIHAVEDRSTVSSLGKRVDPLVKGQMMDLLSTMEALDTQFFFAEPITEDIAPGYFQIVDQPLDFLSIR